MAGGLGEVQVYQAQKRTRRVDREPRGEGIIEGAFFV